MKILLIQPKKPPITIAGDDFSIFEPLALEYLAAGVKHDHDVKLLDMRIEDDMQSVLETFQPDIVGITAYTVHVNVVKKLAETIKNLNANIFIVVGGHHATLIPEDFFNPHIDMIVMGEGVFTFRELVARLDRQESIHAIPGTAVMNNGKSVIYPAVEVDNLDIFPLPDRTFTEQYRSRYFSEWMKPLASMRTSKGCTFNCNFCALWKITNRKYLTRKPEKIVEELTQINEDCVFFADDESLLDPGRMKKLAGLIKDSGLRKRFYLYGRSDTIAKNPGMIELWKESGLERVFVGLEFFRDKDLQLVRKGSTIQNNDEAVRILQSLDIDIYPSFIVRPEFTRDDFKAVRKYCLAFKFGFISFSILTPLPGTDYYNEMKDRLLTHNYDLYDFLHTLLPTELPIKDFYKELVNLYNTARPPLKSLKYLGKFPLGEIPRLFKLYFKLMGQLKNAYKDYE